MSFLDFPDDDPKRRNRRPLLLFLIATLTVGALGSVFTEPNIRGWYDGLLHPTFAPPDWVFAPVWTALYVLMAVAAWRVWRAQAFLPRARESALAGEVAVAGPRASGGRRGWEMTGLKSPALVAYGVQLALNLGWCVIFFGLHQIDAALAEIAILLLAVLITTLLFWKVDRSAGLIFLPYLAWTGFAVLLNEGFWALNP